MSSCYFKDASGNVVPAHYKTPITDSTRRKVIQYSYHQNTDTSDVVRGHGTHVCGTVAGNIDNSDLYSSMFQFDDIYLDIVHDYLLWTTII